MLALQKVHPGSGVQFNMIAPPEGVAAGEVLIRVHSACICGTDLHIAEWTPGYESMEKAMPVTLGHEFSGTIERVGSDDMMRNLISHNLPMADALIRFEAALRREASKVILSIGDV